MPARALVAVLLFSSLVALPSAAALPEWMFPMYDKCPSENTVMTIADNVMQGDCRGTSWRDGGRPNPPALEFALYIADTLP